MPQRRAGARARLGKPQCPLLLQRLGIDSLFDVVVDPASVARGKPAPDIFLAAAAAVGAAPSHVLGIEDSAAGITAIRSAGMASLGIGTAEALPDADRVIPAIGDFRLSDYRAAASA